MNSPHPTEKLIEELVQQLDAEAGTSYDARAELIAIGPDAIPALIAGLPSLGGFGQLTAIETFTAIGDPRCGPALIALLDGDNPTVREWAAEALAGLGIDDAVEPLRRAYRACLEGGTPPDWCEPVSLLWALTELGARTPVVPPLTARLATTVGPDIPGWPSARFAEIVDDLADHGQVILFSQFWRVEGKHTYWTRGPGLEWELDWTAPWPTLVEEARAWSLLEATESPSAEDTYVSITWLSPTDLDRPGTAGQ
ncbi:putative phycocyanin operon protein Z [Streptomyces xanthophaeus]|uniref:HEAT repeat domain-containing protein n=1 Tax=Streptomyces xanthophaeus TaxID=67385 RepID=UPI00233F0C15|nr:HEAT repeat domain-containing protein [Streptomyces xanthophaeus]WCD88427.1 putative phycocyanin operon protein Z [Streptomyces xanthophaeus]